MRDEILVEKIKNVIQTLDEIDDMIKTQSTELQNVDFELSDYYHLIENNELSDVASIKIVKKIHDLRKKRRTLNNEYEIENTYQTHKSKLPGTETRKFLANEIYKTVKKLNSEYKNRIVTENDIKDLLEEKVTKRKPGRPRKEVERVINNEC